MSSSSPNLSQEAIREFLLETQESLEQVEADLVELERHPQGTERATAVGRMFRTLHSIKGTCGFLGYPKLEELAHTGEGLLGRIRDGILQIDATVITALLAVVDAIREVLDHIEGENNEGNEDYSQLTQRLSQIASDRLSQPLEIRADPRESEVADDPSVTRDSSAVTPRPPSSVHDQGRGSSVAGSISGRSDSIAGDLSDRDSQGQSSASLGSSHAGSSSAGVRRTGGRKRAKSDSKVADSALRIDVTLLDKMMLLAGELVLTRNQIIQDQSLDADTRLHGAFRQLNSITSELQSCIMQSRMQPIATIWRQMPRTVRDVALAGFKQVRLEMEGGETELDKTIIEAIRDPLTHILRNSVDHGIELPELRIALGKPAEGRIWMRAYHAGGQVNIEIGDDGGGISAQAIRRTALEHNLVAPAQVSQMSDLALLNLIFQPGFSTKQRVTKLSGRGVGLDVVKSNIESLGGAIHVQSTHGEGTTFTLRIPLTLAIVQALIVQTAGDNYVVPQSRIVELIRFRGPEAHAMLNESSGIPNFRFRGELLPIVDLRSLLELAARDGDPDSLEVNLVVLRVHDRLFGLIVDHVIDNQEVVIKPLWQPLRGIITYAGATQLADGTVALILDPVGLAKRAGLVALPHESEPEERTPPPEVDARQRVLLAQLESGERIALATDRLQRIEEVERGQIRMVHGQEMMEYGGEIIRVVDVASLVFGSTSSVCHPTPAVLPVRSHVAIYGADDETVGVLVGPLVDVVHDELEVRGIATRPHVQFTTMIHDELTEFVDVNEVIESLHGSDEQAGAPAPGE